MDKLLPYFVEKPWGGDFIARAFGVAPKKYGEAWLISTMPGQETRSGPKLLSEEINGELPYLVKVLDAQEPLSVQVHPDDEWAHKLENSRGKTECWLILAAQSGAGIYLGTKPQVTKAQLEAAITRGEDTVGLLEFHTVSRGDFITVPAGTIHAIGAGVTLLEVQQASGITYRLWDWGRQGRELHIEKGLAVANLAVRPQILRDVLSSAAPQQLMQHDHFQVHFNQHRGTGWFIQLSDLAVSRVLPPPGSQYIFVRE